MATIVGVVIEVGLCMYAVVLVCRRYGGSSVEGAKRALRFTLSAFVALQLLAQVGRQMPQGIPPAMATVYCSLAALQGTGTGTGCP